MSLIQRRASILFRPLAPLLVAAASVIVSSGSAFAQATTAPNSPAAAKSAVKVRYEEVVRSVLYMPMYVALNKGFFKDAGLDVTMRTSQGTDKGMAALLSGSADIVLIGPEASIYVANSESPVKPKIFAGLTATDGFMLVSRKPIDKFDWSQLKGKSVMAFRPGSNPDVFLEAALRKHGLDPKNDLKLVSNIGAAARSGAWIAGQNDYAIFLEPDASNLEKDGNGFVMASIGHEVGLVDYTVFTATDAYLQKNPEVAQAWVDAVAHALRYAETAPVNTLAKEVAEFFPGTSQADLVKAIDRYRTLKLWKSKPLVEKAAIEQLQDMLIASGVLENARRVRYDQVVVTDFAVKAK